MVWPFASQKKKPDLDPDLQKYSDDLVSQKEPEPTPPTKLKARSVEAAARHNCAEFANAYARCISYGSFINRTSGCSAELGMLEKCQEMQSFALTTLRFEGAHSNAERKQIKARADDLMIKAAPNLTITPEQEEKFYALVEASSK